MASKRPPPDLIPNPFIKKRNLNWTLDPFPCTNLPKNLSDNESDHDERSSQQNQQQNQQDQPTTSAIEAGRVRIANHLPYFTSLLAQRALESPTPPLLPIASYISLYQSHAQSTRGSHFVIHQHDHPIAGTHYDLRL
ncbi:hypothetical protein E4U54_003023 [Claviceps lovelessii]|nr:hypothetical protein E4U54_003023 [Claviceps lovelessii]